MNDFVNLMDAVSMHQSLLEKRNVAYINLIQQINSRASAVIKDDMGSQFVQNCGRDIAGEVVRTYFDMSNYNITVDQLAMRILKFSYEDEYDPLAENGGIGEIQKSVYAYNDIQSSDLDRIMDELDASQEKLFKKVNGKYEDRPGPDCPAGHSAAGRALLRLGCEEHGNHRTAPAETEGAVHHRHRYPQPVPGTAHRR